MGLDFIRKVAPSFKKALDRRAVLLNNPGLFTQDIPLVARSASADLCNNSSLRAGEKVILRSDGNKTVVQRDNVVVANFESPPADFVQHIHAASGVAQGEVKAVHELSGKVEIEFCE